MTKIKRWLTKYHMFNVPTLIVTIAFILFVILLFPFLNYNDKDSGKIYVTEDAEIRTGPNASYPELYPIRKGEHFNKLGENGKWIEVESSDGKRKGWVAGWHTNLNIAKNKTQNENPLEGKTIVLDPGHGGEDQGASSNTENKSLEKVSTLKTAKELKPLLEKEGAKVKMTRTKDEYVSLGDRNLKGDVFISLHNDALDSDNANGATVFWLKKDQAALAETLNQSIQKKALFSNRGARQQNIQVLRQTNAPAVLLELGYISNPTDEKLINNKLHRQIIEQAIVDGLRNYFME